MKFHLSHSIRYILVATLSLSMAFVEIYFGHGEHHSMSLLADGLHYASHGIVAIVSLFLSVFSVVSLARVRSINLLLLCFLITASIGCTLALFFTGYETHHVFVNPTQIAIIAGISIVAGLIQIKLIGHEHDEIPGERLSHDDVCFGLRWHMIADILKSTLFIMLAWFAMIATPESLSQIDSRMAVAIAVIYGVTMIPVLKRIAQKITNKE